MGRGYERLRIAVTLGAAGSLVPIVAPPAGAATPNLPTGVHRTTTTSSEGGSGPPRYTSVVTSWDLASAAAPFGTKAGYGIDGGKWARRKLCGSTPTTCQHTVKTDAFAAFALVSVNGKVYKAPEGHVDTTTDVFGKMTAQTEPGKVSGLKVSVRHDLLGFVDSYNSLVRVFVTLKNATSTTVTKTVQIGSTLGAGGTTVQDSSDGTPSLERNDSWVLFPSDAHPAIIIARGDRSGAVKADPAIDGNVIDSYRLRIKPHKTVALLYFVVIGGSTGGVSTSKSRFDDAAAPGGPDGLDGLTDTEKAQVKNWSGL